MKRMRGICRWPWVTLLTLLAVSPSAEAKSPQARWRQFHVDPSKDVVVRGKIPGGFKQGPERDVQALSMEFHSEEPEDSADFWKFRLRLTMICNGADIVFAHLDAESAQVGEGLQLSVKPLEIHRTNTAAVVDGQELEIAAGRIDFEVCLIAHGTTEVRTGSVIFDGDGSVSFEPNTLAHRAAPTEASTPWRPSAPTGQGVVALEGKRPSREQLGLQAGAVGVELKKLKPIAVAGSAPAGFGKKPSAEHDAVSMEFGGEAPAGSPFFWRFTLDSRMVSNGIDIESLDLMLHAAKTRDGVVVEVVPEPVAMAAQVKQTGVARTAIRLLVKVTYLPGEDAPTRGYGGTKFYRAMLTASADGRLKFESNNVPLAAAKEK